MSVHRTVVRSTGPWIGAPGYNIFHADLGSGSGIAEYQLATDTLRQFFTAIRGLFPTAHGWTHDGEWVDVNTFDLISTTGWSQTGTSTGQYLPAQTCLVAGWNTTTRTRSGRGRSFLGPVSDSTRNTDGTPSGEARTAITNAAAALAAFDGGITGDLGFVVYSPTQNIGRKITGARVRDVYAHLTSRRQ